MVTVDFRVIKYSPEPNNIWRHLVEYEIIDTEPLENWEYCNNLIRLFLFNNSYDCLVDAAYNCENFRNDYIIKKDEEIFLRLENVVEEEPV